MQCSSATALGIAGRLFMYFGSHQKLRQTNCWILADFTGVTRTGTSAYSDFSSKWIGETWAFYQSQLDSLRPCQCAT